jgi:NADH:ubiquinone oxidoreductase subunit 4 (subunit M)
VKSAFYGEMPSRWETLNDARTPFQKMPFALLIAVLLFFGFHPQSLLSVIEQGTKPIVASLDAAKGREQARAQARAGEPQGPSAPTAAEAGKAGR